MQLNEHLLKSVLHLTDEAGQILKKFYCQPIEIYHKSDNTPVTDADLYVSQFLIEKLTALTPNIPVLSEENCNIPVDIRQSWERYWLIDPLDGTQQFIDKTGQFSILISLIHQNRPVLGVIHSPILDTTYYAMHQFGAYKKQRHQVQRLPRRHIDLMHPLKIAIGQTSNPEKVRSILAKDFSCEFVFYGSSGLKSALVAEGSADCYVRLGDTGEWDTAAAEVLLSETNGVIFDRNFSSLTYNQRDHLINPHFVMAADAQINWQKIFQFNL
ncbi:3'(2'),5'-bisphosphate nucleotidase CysQ [Pasteurellaceae bacterium Pebbles2]|nr:3'(2'),5'-bisphosphate nucleotidase CysQ [Pasteurellaceae bacterium Pebbles2]